MPPGDGFTAFVGGSIVGVIVAFKLLGMINEARVNAKMAETYDDVSYRCIAIGFPLLTIGIITGGLWANHAWGSYWSWDPKESMALVTWLSYAAYIHLRVYRDLKAENLAHPALQRGDELFDGQLLVQSTLQPQAPGIRAPAMLQDG